MDITLIFPHQLFQAHPAVTSGRKVFLVEEYLFFNQYKFHQQKILFHRATMRFYQDALIEQGIEVTYISAQETGSDVRNLLVHLKEIGVTNLHFADPVDYLLERRLHRGIRQLGFNFTEYTTPYFLNSKTDLETYFKGKKKLFQTDFYTQQRKKRNILLEEDGKPTGGKWTFDTENRLKYPKGKTPPKIVFPIQNKYITEAIDYVNAYYSGNYGQLNPAIIYPTTFEEAEIWLENFLKTRFQEFGEYEDALVAKEHFLHHSLLTPMLNVGLLLPQQIIERSLQYAAQNDIPLNSTEGFVRQIIGWREFIRGVYVYKGTEERTKNHWKFTRKIPHSFWTGTTGIPPIDEVIKKTLATSYNHHIERLMVLGNFMLLCEFDPNEVHRWFMEMYIDAYDWVMVPNVYGMSQFADGGLMATKPYISGSNYLMKMSDFPKGDWQPIWDGLFWRFMHVHRDFFLQNPRLGMLVTMFDKMPEEKRQAHLQVAEAYLESL
jgi:deoxyribodipyrimidine photolyase-related protein